MLACVCKHKQLQPWDIEGRKVAWGKGQVKKKNQHCNMLLPAKHRANEGKEEGGVRSWKKQNLQCTFFCQVPMRGGDGKGGVGQQEQDKAASVHSTASQLV